MRTHIIIFLFAFAACQHAQAADSIRQLRLKAEQGNAAAQCELGNRYYSGVDVEENNIEAVAWYRKAADQGHAMAQRNLAVMYSRGLGVEKNKVEANKLFNKAIEQRRKDAEQGGAEEQYILGVLYYEGEDNMIIKDEIESMAWLYLARSNALLDSNQQQTIRNIESWLDPASRQMAQKRAKEYAEKIAAGKPTK